ncbi:DUF6265 family protein [Flavobacterium agrisoli]|uniref:DUF6265 domain-containing protein n=1 Tax=Flavobacterium agrisoli TaxID=2793066 RepID=A0A934PMG0_9FLAO|nr:DUF6265 family protein [Flavobacterium agrisoli]MBK0369073.1 hypothetical protein [Flavobacterium agrisoli]
MKKSVPFFMIFSLLCACQKNNSGSENKVQKASWLVGNWESKSEFGTLTESWQKVNDSTFTATSYFVNLTKDTIHSETVSLFQKGDSLYYRATVKGQNEDKPVDFVLKSESENALIFENPKHDYPQKIAYTKKGKANLEATISGLQAGKLSSEKYAMIKK